MADGAGPALGLSIGNTNLAAVTAGHAITRKPVLTLYRQRPPEVGVPSENSRLDQPGLVFSDFVSRVGGRSGIKAADGSVHRSEGLVADALRALAYTATGGGALPDSVAVTYPAHWNTQAVEAVGAALARVSEWSNRARPLTLIADAAAALFAAGADPGIPGRGTVAVCDFGGTGTNITLMDAAGDYHALAPTVRHHDFCGDLIDQQLLSAVMADLPTTVSFAAIGSLGRLRAKCRNAKEQLSSSTVATLSGDGRGGEVRLTRDQLEDAIRAPLSNFVAVMEKTLASNGLGDLAAIVAVGGGAHIPAVTTTLSGHFRVPVVSTPRPQLTAAIGAALRAARGRGESSVTAAAAPVPATARLSPIPTSVSPRVSPPVTGPPPAASTVKLDTVAWPKSGGFRLATDTAVASDADASATIARPEPASAPEPESRGTRRRYLRPALAVIPAVLAVLLVGIAAAIGLSAGEKSAPTPAPGVNTTPAPPGGGAAAQQSNPPQSPPTSDTNPPVTTDTPSTTAPPATPQAVLPVPAAHEDVPAAPQAPPAQRLPPAQQLPPIPGIDEPIPGLDRLDRILQGVMGGAGLGDLSQVIPRSFGQGH